MVNKEEINCLDSLCWLSSEEISKHQRILSNKLLILVNLAAFSCLDSLFWLPLEKSILGNILAHWENNPEIWEHILPIENIELEFSCLDSLCWLPMEERGRYSAGHNRLLVTKLLLFDWMPSSPSTTSSSLLLLLLLLLLFL